MWKSIAFAAVVWLGVGCGGKGRDCDAYTAKVVDLSNPTPENVGVVEKVSRDACTSGRVSDKELACAQKATTRQALIECTTGETPAPPPKPPAAPSGRISLSTVGNAGDFKVIDESSNPDQRAWMNQIEKDLAVCGSETYAPERYSFIVTFGGGPPVVTAPRNLPPEIGSCIIPVLSRPPPASVKNGPIEITIDVSK